MEADLLVELSPKEEIVLRRIAQGIAEPNTPSPKSIEWLKALIASSQKASSADVMN